MVVVKILCVHCALMDQIISGITVHTVNTPIQDMGRLMRANVPVAVAACPTLCTISMPA